MADDAEEQIHQVSLARQPSLNGYPQEPPSSRRHGGSHKDAKGNIEVPRAMKERTTRPRHQYHTRSKTRNMEQAIDDLDTALNAAAVAQGTPTYPPRFTPQYGMPLGWNTTTEGQTSREGHKQAGVNNLAAKVAQRTAGLPQPTYVMGLHAQVDISRQTGPTLGIQGTTPLGEEKLNSLEERVRITEGTDSYGLNATDLCLVPDIELSADFKTPKFKKYKGSSCPRDKILGHCFQDSLTGVALCWYVNLEKGRVKTWRDLAEAFVCQ
ncbi:hypothetical protein CR513_48389, partial [Mucuna pruriens]